MSGNLPNCFYERVTYVGALRLSGRVRSALTRCIHFDDDYAPNLHVTFAATSVAIMVFTRVSTLAVLVLSAAAAPLVPSNQVARD